MADTKISALAVATAPDQTELLACIQGGVSKQVSLDVALTARDYWVCLTATNVLTFTTAEQSLFDSVGTGKVTLPAGTYLFECLVALSAMASGGSNNCSFAIKGAGTATLASILYYAVGVDGSQSVAASQTGSISFLNTSNGPIVQGSGNTTAYFSIRGSFRVTVDGTIIPSISLSDAAAAVVAVGSYFRCHMVGAAASQSAGPY